jgi:hypothetical protein
MHNTRIEIVKDELVIRCKLNGQTADSFPPSSSGKTRLVASTGGAAPIAYPKLDGLKVALNITIPFARV